MGRTTSKFYKKYIAAQIALDFQGDILTIIFINFEYCTGVSSQFKSFAVQNEKFSKRLKSTSDNRNSR
jgi:hypothetical protein